MAFIERFLLAAGLSMDAFAVSVCKGLSVSQVKKKHMLLAGLYFGGFQAAMPVLGYGLGIQFQEAITAIDHWIAFVLLGFIGITMLKESQDCRENRLDDSFDAKTMAALAVATSIDALAVGVTFAFLQVRILPAVSLIGIITFFLSMAGVKAGNAFGSRCRCKAQFAGGLILVFMGVKILAEHLLNCGNF